jgi:hypothetical protein
MLSPRLRARHCLALGQARDGLLDPGHGFAGVLDDAIAQCVHDAQVVLRQAVAAQRGFAEKRGTTCQIGWAARAIHEHRAQIALRAGVPGVGCNSVKPSSQYVVTRDRSVARLKTTRELEKRLRFATRRGELGDGGNDRRLRGRKRGA